MANTMNMNNETANNQVAAKEANKIFSTKSVKESLAKLAKYGSGVFKTIINGIHDMSGMTDEEVRNTVSETFKTAKTKIQIDLSVINSIPSYRDSYLAKDLTEALENLISVEKEILKNKDINVMGKVLIMFWTGCKAIAAMIVKSCIKAANFVAVYGIRIICVGLDFVIKIVKKAVKLFKEVWTVVKAIKVSKNGNKEEEIKEGAYI